MMQDRIVSQRNACIAAIDESKHIDDNDKILYRDLINNAANGTNGLSPETKLQNVSETVFSLVMLKIMDKCSNNVSGNKIQSLYQMISDCKWAICILVAILGIVFILRPELSSLIITAAAAP